MKAYSDLDDVKFDTSAYIFSHYIFAKLLSNAKKKYHRRYAVLIAKLWVEFYYFCYSLYKK